MQDSRVESAPLPAPLLQRACALVIDAFFLFLIFIFTTLLLGDPDVEKTATFATLLALTSAYHIGFLVSQSMTPGKMAMGIWVSDGHGNRVRPDQAILRHLVTATGALGIISFEIALFFQGVALLSILMVLVDRKGRRAVHDWIAGTRVVRGRPPETKAWGSR